MAQLSCYKLSIDVVRFQPFVKAMWILIQKIKALVIFSSIESSLSTKHLLEIDYSMALPLVKTIFILTYLSPGDFCF